MGTAVGPRGPVAGISSRVAKCRLTAGVVVVGGAGRGGFECLWMRDEQDSLTC